MKANTKQPCFLFREQLLEHLRTFLSSSEAKQCVMEWPHEPPPSATAELWKYIHRYLPYKGIRHAIASVLYSWELQAGHFTDAENILVNHANELIQPIEDELDQVERTLRSVSSSLDETVYGAAPRTSRKQAPKDVPKLSSLWFHLKYSDDLDKPRDNTVTCDCITLFQSNKKEFMQTKSREVLEQILNDDDELNAIVTYEQELAMKYIEDQQSKLAQTVSANLKLVNRLKEEKEKPNRMLYRQLALRIRAILDEAMQYNNQHLRCCEFEGSGPKAGNATVEQNAMFVPMMHDDQQVTLVQTMRSGPQAVSLYLQMIRETQLR